LVLGARAALKIAVIFNAYPELGGQFHHSLNAIKQFKRICGELFDIQLFHSHAGGDLWLKDIGEGSILLRQTALSKFIEGILRSPFKQFAGRLKIVSPREKLLLSNGIDLVYFPSPNSLCHALQVLNYVATIYDACHREFPEFPEVGVSKISQNREAYNRSALERAVLTIADSESLKSRLCHMYGALEDRVLSMPYTLSDKLASNESSFDHKAISRYAQTSGYLFYPAQFWAHKNHVRIVQAIQLLKQRGRMVDVAFAGSDYGGQKHVMNTAANLGVADQVHLLGFVPSEDLASLYKGALALVMPTYFGPTNLPPLEAWSLDVPVIYSSHLSSGIEDGVLPVDPDCPESIAQAIETVMQEGIRRDLIAGGRRCLARVNAEAASSEAALRQHLVRFARRRETWK
jgi:glycosyltransferase involved in cell wall biosynthesis